MKKIWITLAILLISVIIIAATKTFRNYDTVASLTSTDVFLVTRDSSGTDVTNGFTWKTLVNQHKDSITVNGLDSLNITGVLTCQDSIISVGLGSSGDIELSGSKQIYGNLERWIKIVYITYPDTLPKNLAYVIDNYIGATITIDSIRIEHDADSLNWLGYKKNQDSTVVTNIYSITKMTTQDTIICFQSATLANKWSLGIGEATGQNTNPTFLKVTYIGHYTRAKLNNSGRTCGIEG